MNLLDIAASRIRALPGACWRGEVVSAIGMMIESHGLEGLLTLGDKCRIRLDSGERLLCEVVGVREDRSLLMPFGDPVGVFVGAAVEFDEQGITINPSDDWIGRVINAFAEPIDEKGELTQGEFATPLRNTPPPAHARRRVESPLVTGVKVIDAFTPICHGQRIGLFAGSGVGKSTLLSMLARFSGADVNVIGLIGERGREVQEFLQRDLGESGLARSIVVVSTSDQSPLERRQAARLTMAIAEDQRKRGRHVLCLMDSVTRYAQALREIGLAVGEPPTARGFPPSVFAELAHLLERAGPGIAGQGDITLAATVLVDGDDHDDPIADAVRGILDGHIVLDRKIALRGRFPSVDVMKSISRTAPDSYHSIGRAKIAAGSRELIARYAEREEVIQLGLYAKGTDERIDVAIEKFPLFEEFCRQSRDVRSNPEEAFAELARIVNADAWVPEDPPARAQRAPEMSEITPNAAATLDIVAAGSRRRPPTQLSIKNQ